jgi:rod shape-determining protein MreC
MRGIRWVLIGVLSIVLFAIFLIWRIDNARVEQLRMSVIDRFVPGFEWTLKPVASAANMISDVRAYSRVYAQNEELRRELQRMKGWREAALQLEQKNARLLALNNVRLSPRLTFITAEVVADAGSPYRRSAIVNVGRSDGVADGSAVVDGMGLVGRIAGVGEHSARVILLTDASSRVPAAVRPSGQRALVAGHNGEMPVLEFLDQPERANPGDRVVTTGAGGLFPADILVGRVAASADGRQRLLPAADFRRLDYVRIVRFVPRESIDGPGGLIGPRIAERRDNAPQLAETRP